METDPTSVKNITFNTPTGDTVLNNVSHLSSGGSANVYRAELDNYPPLVVKVLKTGIQEITPELADYEHNVLTTLRRDKTAARFLIQSLYAGKVNLVGDKTSPGYALIEVMAAGDNLDSLLTRDLNLTDSLQLLDSVAEAVDAVNKAGGIDPDFAPTSVFVEFAGNTPQSILIDAGEYLVVDNSGNVKMHPPRSDVAYTVRYSHPLLIKEGSSVSDLSKENYTTLVKLQNWAFANMSFQKIFGIMPFVGDINKPTEPRKGVVKPGDAQRQQGNYMTLLYQLQSFEPHLKNPGSLIGLVHTIEQLRDHPEQYPILKGLKTEQVGNLYALFRSAFIGMMLENPENVSKSDVDLDVTGETEHLTPDKIKATFIKEFLPKLKFAVLGEKDALPPTPQGERAQVSQTDYDNLVEGIRKLGAEHGLEEAIEGAEPITQDDAQELTQIFYALVGHKFPAGDGMEPDPESMIEELYSLWEDFFSASKGMYYADNRSFIQALTKVTTE